MKNELNIDWIITLLVWFFFGAFGFHRFLNGRIISGLLMLFTLGGFGIWWLIDGILIISGNLKKRDGTLVTMKVSY